MSLPFRQLYEFGEFRLDLRERTLIQGDQPVELTPKGFELLTIFVENQGRLLGKEELMENIWSDSFVEEGNLTFNIRQLRVILGDDAHEPKYIKTVRRHGYRFIADVRHISEVDTSTREIKSQHLTPLVSEPVTNMQRPSVPTKTGKFFSPALLVVAVFLVCAAVTGAWYVSSKGLEPSAPVLSAPFVSEKLSANGKVFNSVLSPDGKKVVYTNGRGKDKESLWLRQLDDGTNVELIPPANDIYAGLSFSPDGNMLYFTRRPRLSNEPPGIYRISIFGGIPQKLLSETEGWMSLSPDGARISFVRCPRLTEENCALWVADAADGKNERKLVSRIAPVRISANRFSPDGKRIAFAAGQSENAANDFGLSEVDLETGKERELTSEKFFNIRQLAWLPDGSGWLLTASRIPNKNGRIWQVSAATGKASAITRDSECYSMLSLDKDATEVVTTQIKENFSVRLFRPDNPAAGRVLGDATSASIAPNDKIYFSSFMSGNDEIWSVNQDGTGQRQLTNTMADELMPLASRAGDAVFFTSNRTGEAQIWRMDPNGGNQIQITQKEGGFPMFVSPDGKWLYYQHGLNRTIWRVSVNGTGEQMVLNKAKSYFAFSPDGTQVAFSEAQGDERILTLVSLADGQPVKTFRLADRKARLLNLVWMPDGKNIIYVSADREFQNNTLWQQPLDELQPRQIASLGDQELRGFGLSVSADGKTFAIVQGEWLHDAVLLKGLR